MARVSPLLFALSFILAMLWSRAAHADPRTGFFVEQLKTNEDYRVRTQAALALGASADDAAVQPLCDALGADSNVSVRVAAAAALGKLAKPAALPCLKAAEAKESAPAVKSQIQKAAAALAAGGGGGGGVGAPPPPGADSKFYVAIQVTNKTSRAAADVDALIRGTMQSKLLGKKGYAVAPKSETTAQGGAIVKGKNLKGFFLIATIEAPIYENGSLTQVVRVTMWTYPGKALQAEFAPRLTQESTPKGDTASETTLMKMAVENAIESFAKVAASL